MGIKLAAASGGSVELVPTNTASNFTATMPARTGNVAVDGPAFSAYNSSSQAVSTATYTKIQFNTEEFDTNSNYDNATNYRFTPTVAGYYQVNLVIGNATGTVTATYTVSAIYKNGSIFKSSLAQAAVNGPASSVSALIQMNGSTDYIEGYWFQNTGGSQSTTAGQAYTFFQASMVRAA
jgi:hypothetical protein